MTARIWARLGIEPTGDAAQIRRAYARALKRTHPEDDPEGFAALRAAYEAALGWAQTAPAVPAMPAVQAMPAAPAMPATSAKQQAATPDEAPPPLEDPDLVLLRREFQRLQEALAAEPPRSAESLQSQLDDCLRSRALETIAVSLAFEDALAGVLWMHRVRADALIERAVTHFGWREARRRQGPCLALAAYADHVRPLREARDGQPRAYRALTDPPRGARLWWRILRYRLDRQVHPVWRSLSAVAKALPAAVNREALDWWDRYFTRPHPQPLLIQLASLLTLLGGIVGFAVGSDSARAGQGALLGCLAGALTGSVLTGAYLAAVDWPRQWLRDRRRASTPVGKLGWMPAILGLCLLAGVAPDTVVGRSGIGLLASAVFLWAIIVTPEAGLGTPEQIVQRLWGKLLANVPLGVWWVALRAADSRFPTVVMWWTLVAAMGAFAFGVPALFVEYRRALTPGMQRAVRLSMGAIAAASAFALWLWPVAPAWRGPLLMAMAVIVLLQRVPALALTPLQLRWRYYLTVPASVVLVAPLSSAGSAGPFRLCGALYMSGVAVCMLASEYGESLSAWRESRRAPVLKARL